MKMNKRIIPAAVLSLMLVLGMFAGSPDLVYSASEGSAADMSVAARITASAEGSDTSGKFGVRSERTSIVITEANSIFQKTDYFKKYELIPGSGSYTEYECKAYMPVAGTLIIEAGSDQGATCNVSARGQGVTYIGPYTLNGATSYMYNVSSPATVDIDVTVIGSGKSAWIGAFYADAGWTMSGNTSEFVLGSAGNGAVSTFNVSVPSTGYLSIAAINELNTGNSVYYNTNGFDGWDYRSNGAPLKIGVKKGTYTVSLKGAPYYTVSVRFTKVKETSSGTGRKKAGTIKKGKVNKGIIAVNSKKVHWYKIKNPKNQKMNIALNAMNMAEGGSGYLKITAYFPKGKPESTMARTGQIHSFSLISGRLGTKKAVKGTYYLKIESKRGASGYYTLKWK